MLSIGKLASGQEAYYLSAVAQGVEDYYTGSGEAPGVWLGGGAAALGLEGVVADADLHCVLTGIDPLTGEALGRSNRKLPGFDFTYSAPKSVSLIWALGAPAVQARVVAAHDRAVAASLGYLERQAAFVRRGRDGLERMESSGLVAAAFRHRTSRAGDPQLHTHVLIANAAQGVDGRWGALDARLLYLHRMVAGYLYQAQLRVELTRSLGVRWRPVVKGLSEIEGIKPSILRGFSQRRVEIEARLGELGLSGRRAAEIAALDTRRAKTTTVDGESLFEECRQRAELLGLDQQAVDAIIRPGRRPIDFQTNGSALGEALTEHASTFDRRHVLQHLAGASTDGADISALEVRADNFLASPTAGVVRLRDGYAGPQFSTKDLMACERRVLSTAIRSQGDGVARASETAIEAVLEARPMLVGEQADMVPAITSSGAGVEVVVGAAGTGKTAAFEAARAIWARDGRLVIGVALAARAAAELQAGSGIPSFTIASVLMHLERGQQLAARSVLVVDEAGMVGTRQLDKLLTHARWAKAKVVLVGDHRQLPEINAGGAFRALVERLPARHLTVNRRQRDRQERKAAAALRAGRVGEAVARLDSLGHITRAEDPDELRWAMVAEWWEQRQQGKDVAMLAVGRAEVDALNRAARAVLDDAGALGKARLTAFGREFAVGDEVVCGRNNRRIGVLNGTRGVVEAVRPDDAELDFRTDGGVEVTLPAEYLLEGHLAHSYATTLHKAQGRTYDVSLVWADERLHNESGYVGITRGREVNRLYALDQIDGQAHVGGERAALSPNRDRERNSLILSLSRSDTQGLASELTHQSDYELSV